MVLSGQLQEVYRRLYQAYGPQNWWPGEGPFEVIVGAILTQSAAWTNVEKALDSMRAADCWSFAAIHQIPEAELAVIVRPSGYFNAKARKLKAFAAHLAENYGVRPEDLIRFLAKETGTLREELLSIHGIGDETADDIVVYAAEKPSFVIDSYTRRIIDRMGLAPSGKNPKYGDYQELFHANLPADTALFNEYHALLDRHAKDPCAKREPRCGPCCLADICTTGMNVTAEND
jgi:endonuclease-3 related protein